MADVTNLLADIERGNANAAGVLLPLVYEELRKLAAQRMTYESAAQTLAPTALVHEAYLRLVGTDGDQAMWANRAHFFSAAAQAMRRILIDRAREKRRIKRGGGRVRLSLDAADGACDSAPGELLDLDEALCKLAAEDATKAKLVELRFFGGLTLPEAAATLGVSTPTAERYWAYARAWLFDALNYDESAPTD